MDAFLIIVVEAENMLEFLLWDAMVLTPRTISLISKHVSLVRGDTYHSRVRKIGLWVTFVRSIQGRKFYWISDEEYGLRHLVQDMMASIRDHLQYD